MPLNNKQLKVINKTVEDFFKKSTFVVEVAIEEKPENVLFFNLKVEEPQTLIGSGGHNLQDLQFLLSRILQKRVNGFFAPDSEEARFRFEFDINGYRQQKEQYLQDLAQDLADQAVLTKAAKEFPSMLAFERRIVHTALAKRGDVQTESIGEGEERRVLVKPISKQ